MRRATAVRALILALAVLGLGIKVAMPYETVDTSDWRLPSQIAHLPLESRIEQTKPEEYTVFVLDAPSCRDFIVAVPAVSQEIPGIVRYRMEQPDSGLFLYGGELYEAYPAGQMLIDAAWARLASPFSTQAADVPWFLLGSGLCANEAALRDAVF